LPPINNFFNKFKLNNKMKVISKLLMCALVLSVFAGCSKDDEEKDLPLEGVAGNYKGTITVQGKSPVTGENVDPIPDAVIVITYDAGKKSATLSVNDLLGVGSGVSATATCTVKSTKDNYSLDGSGTASVPTAAAPMQLLVFIANSNIDKAGNADINITVPLSETDTTNVLLVNVKGKKQ
jgi:hypothetical protein